MTCLHYCTMFYTEHGFKIIIIIVVAQSHGMAIISKSVFISVNDFERRVIITGTRYYRNTLLLLYIVCSQQKRYYDN